MKICQLRFFSSFSTLKRLQPANDNCYLRLACSNLASKAVASETLPPLTQLATITDPNSGVTTYNYDASSRLSTVQNASSGNPVVLTLTYDSADRIRTRTDDQGYVLTYDYDNIDRVTKITYPDATTDLYDYTFQSGPYVGTASQELRKHTDRLGRVTTYGYDAARRLTSVTEPTSGAATRTTNYAYYEDGTLKELTDANGNVTHWDIDIQSRPTKKTYAYGTALAKFETYTYENTTSRLKSIKDWCTRLDLNQQPSPSEGGTLSN